MDESAFLDFKSREEAERALETVGYACVQKVAQFTSQELTQAVSELLQADGVVFMDMTSAIPDTSQAAYKALTIAGFSAAAACRKDKKAAFLVMRTKMNSPSFLFGMHWADVQVFGKDVADARVKKGTPSAVVMFGEKQIAISSAICEVHVSIAAKMVAFYLTLKADHFCCSVCKTPFITIDTGGESIREMAVDGSGNMFLRSCAEKIARENCDL